MLVDTFANRLQKAMSNANLKQSELAEKTKLDKSLISNYLSGNYNAKQDKLSILADVLGVTETWLMGYDVPMTNETNIITENFSELDNLLWSKAIQLNDEEKKAVLQVMDAIHKDVDKEIDNN